MTLINISVLVLLFFAVHVCIMLQVKIKSLKYMVIVAMEWKDHLVRSDEFDNPSGHQNPNSMPVESYTIKADPVKVGAFILSKGKLQYHM